MFVHASALQFATIEDKFYIYICQGLGWNLGRYTVFRDSSVSWQITITADKCVMQMFSN